MQKRLTIYAVSWKLGGLAGGAGNHLQALRRNTFITSMKLALNLQPVTGIMM